MTLEITEVRRRSEHGMTRPFICRGDDGAVYFVKGRDAGKAALIREWICGCLGRTLGLPIASFDIAWVPGELIAGPASLELDDLGDGPVFASRERRVSELTLQSAAEIPPALRRDVLVFDWWVKNGDRSLTERGGNPNLFWAPDSKELVIIDHNVALDDTLMRDEFLADHVFRDEAETVFNDLAMRAEYTARLESAIMQLDAATAAIPAQWRYHDADELDSVAFDWVAMKTLLSAFRTEGFWAIR
ncbi:HipA family kinase [Salinisphaera japonica]|uniref:HipA-like kinase domain-containing protein n=1 Tax=Salinisphaera japonica YTM-1 TaxID=1209778 RepID=A0A423PPN5_9GAMM|nr:HipA family kinase [Salinisphaera japonica]ROO27575.1 hypothetical protein SAJA_09150 [Salinisphaera japonica YTM-1]